MLCGSGIGWTIAIGPLLNHCHRRAAHSFPRKLYFYGNSHAISNHPPNLLGWFPWSRAMNWLQLLSSIRPKYWLLCCVIGIMLVYFLYSEYEHDPQVFRRPLPAPKQVTNRPNKDGIFMNVPLVINRTDVPGAAYAFLALGAQANQMNCPAAIESLVKYAGWDGHIYLITDRKECFQSKTIVANAGMDKSKFHYVVVEEDFSHGGVDFRHPKVGARKSRVRSFEMKTRLFEFVDQSISTLAYVDCDVLFGLPNCASEFLLSGPSWDEAHIKFTHIHHNEQNELRDIHAGSFVAHREHSKELMRIWKERLALRVDEGDNDAFMAAYNHYKHLNSSSSVGQAVNLRRAQPAIAPVIAAGSGKKAINPMEPALVMRPGGTNASDEDFLFEKFSKGILGEVMCINHISKARCTSVGREQFQEYVNQFHLATYKKGEHYCVSKWLMTFEYGWMPLGYIPGCPKLETLL